jgi:uncharacterized protein YggE
MFRRLLAPAAITTAVLCLAAPAVAQTTDAAFRTTTLNLSAQGEVRQKPDVATMVLGVSTEAVTAKAASEEVARRIDAIVASLRRAGVAPRDIQTQFISLSPRYAERRGDAPREITAHQATTTLTVTARDIGRAGALLDLAVAAGVNEVRGVRFSLSDPATAQRQARDLALQTLQEDAVHVAEVMRQRVVRLVSVNTQAFIGRAPAAEYRIEPAAMSGSRIDPGESVVTGSANGVFELAPR